jgi:Cytochrome P450
MDPKTYQNDNSHMDIVADFQPERWLSEQTMPSEFIPLGAGPRYCLGANLAYAEMKVFLAEMAMTIDFSLIDYQPNTKRYSDQEKSGVGKKKNKIRWKRYSILPKEKNGLLVDVKPLAPSRIPML